MEDLGMRQRKKNEGENIPRKSDDVPSGTATTIKVTAIMRIFTNAIPF
jgi:hypothetical protein